ncbi:MAG: YopX family protein [Tannerella sp.]|nr:YopX family protein [Tannerella sp.]
MSGGAVGDYIFNCPSMTEVVPETVGQFTGLLDMNGKEIYEGDIVASVLGRYGQIISIGDVQFDCGVFGVEWIDDNKDRSMVGGWGQRHNLRSFDDDIIDRIEVIGNIHERKHLLITEISKSND